MTHTITALFDTRADAEAAETRLKSANLETGAIGIHDNSTPDFHATGRSSTTQPGLWASIKNVFLPDEDRHTYEEGVRRGGFLLTADVAEDQIDAAINLLDEADTVDLDRRAEEWLATGWDYSSNAIIEPVKGDHAIRGNDAAAQTSSTSEFIVGRRDANRGSARVRSYVRDLSKDDQG